MLENDYGGDGRSLHWAGGRGGPFELSPMHSGKTHSRQRLKWGGVRALKEQKGGHCGWSVVNTGWCDTRRVWKGVQGLGQTRLLQELPGQPLLFVCYPTGSPV